MTGFDANVTDIAGEIKLGEIKLVIVYSKLLDFSSHLHRQFATGDNEEYKTIVIQWNPALLPPR